MKEPNGINYPAPGEQDYGDALERATQFLGALMDDGLPPYMKKKIQAWFRSEASVDAKYDALGKLFNELQPNLNPDRYEYEQFEKIREILGFPPSEPAPAVKRRLTPGRIALRVAAVVIPALMIAGASWLWFSRPQPAPQIAMVTMAVPDTLGAQGRIDLTDGSEVFVRPGSSISYAEDFEAGDKRRVQMSGEAYFEVAADSVKQFIVETAKMNVTVLGTRFNVEASPDKEFTTVTLYQGKVNVSGLTGKEGVTEVILQPGRKLVYNNLTGEYKIEDTAALLPDWIASRLTFRNAPYSEIFRTLEWFYGVKVELDGNLGEDMKLNFRITGQEDIETAMWLFRNVSREFTYEIDGSMVKIKPEV